MDSSTKYKKLFVITSRFPFPLEKGDKLRAYYQIKELSKHFEVHLISTSENRVPQQHIQELQAYCKSIHVYPIPLLLRVWGAGLQLIGSKPIQVGYFYHFSIQKKISRLIRQIQPDHIYCQLVRAAEYVKNYHSCPKTIDYMDALSKGMERRSELSKFPKKQFFTSEYKKLLYYENAIFEYFEHHTIISQKDKDYIFHKKREQIVVVPNGVNPDFLDFTATENKSTDLVFIGNMSYSPNIKAAQFIVKKLLPQLSNNISATIAGASPSAEVLKLASPKVRITGYVDDIKKIYLSGRIFVAPMFIGTGLQNKLLEAMALGIPCVTTSLANSALGAKPEEEILIADNEADFLRQINRLLSDPKLAQQISIKARSFIIENYDWEIACKKLVELIQN